MHWLKLRIVVLTTLSLVLCGLSINRGMMQNNFPFFVSPQWSHDGSRVAIVEDTAIVIYDVISGGVVHRLEEHTDTINSVNWSPIDPRLASASADQTVRVWDSTTGTLLHTLTGHGEAVSVVVWFPDATRLISSGVENQPNLFVWDTQTGAVVSTSSAGTFVDAAFSPNGDMLAMSYSLGLSLFNAETLQRTFHQPPTLCCANRMETLAWSPDGNRIVTGSINGLITIWDAATLTQISQFQANPYYVEDSREAPDVALSWVRDVVWGLENSIQAISGDGTIRQWDEEGNLLQEAQIGPLDAALWSPYGARLAIQGSTNASLASAQRTTRASTDGVLQFIVPFASAERLQAVAGVCDTLFTVAPSLDAEITAGNIENVIAQVEALPDNTPSSGCEADLLAVAEAIAALPVR